MAATATVVDRGAFGDLFSRIVDVALDDSYQGGGYALTSQELGFGTNGVVKLAIVPTVGGYICEWDYDAQALLVLVSADGDPSVEADDDTDLSDFTARILVLGQGQG